jgi:hypothetical protein
MINLNYLQETELIYNQTNLSFYNISIKKNKISNNNSEQRPQKNRLIKRFEKYIKYKMQKKKHNVKNLITTFKLVNHTFVSVNI